MGRVGISLFASFPPDVLARMINVNSEFEWDFEGSCQLGLEVNVLSPSTRHFAKEWTIEVVRT